MSIQVLKPKFEIDECLDAVRECLEKGWTGMGFKTVQFEEAWKEYTGHKNAYYINSNTVGLHLAVKILKMKYGWKDGDEIISTPITFVSTNHAILYENMHATFADVDEYLCLDPVDVEKKINDKTRAVIFVGYGGRAGQLDKVIEVCKKHNLKLIEDNAQAHGCKHTDGRTTGSIGDAAGHSFYPGKNLGALGDGGAVTTNDDALAEAVRILANYGSSKKYVFKYTGRNSRLDEIQAAVLDVKLKYLVEDNAHRKLVANYYYDHISNPLVSLPDRLPNEQNAYHLFPILVADGKRDALHDYLEQNGVGTVIHYPIAPHKQECYKEWNTISLPITERIADEELSLPIGPAITMKEVAEVVNLINQFR